MGKDGDPAGITVRAPHPGGHVPPGDTSRHPSVQGSRNKARGMAAPSGMPVIPEKAKDVSILEKAHPAAFPLSRSRPRARGSSSLVPTRRGPRQGSIPVYGQQLAWLRAGSTAGQGMSRHWVSWWVLPGHLLGQRPHGSRRGKRRGGEGGRHRGSWGVDGTMGRGWRGRRGAEGQEGRREQGKGGWSPAALHTPTPPFLSGEQGPAAVGDAGRLFHAWSSRYPGGPSTPLPIAQGVLPIADHGQDKPWSWADPDPACSPQVRGEAAQSPGSTKECREKGLISQRKLYLCSKNPTTMPLVPWGGGKS